MKLLTERDRLQGEGERQGEDQALFKYMNPLYSMSRRGRHGMRGVLGGSLQVSISSVGLFVLIVEFCRFRY